MMQAMKTTVERGFVCTERQNWATLISPRCAGWAMDVRGRESFSNHDPCASEQFWLEKDFRPLSTATSSDRSLNVRDSKPSNDRLHANPDISRRTLER